MIMSWQNVFPCNELLMLKLEFFYFSTCFSNKSFHISHNNEKTE